MVDKNLVDDYYTKIPSDNDLSDDKNVVKKVVLKAKKKLVVKKVVRLETLDNENKDNIKDEIEWEIVNSNKQRSVIQKIKVVKRENNKLNPIKNTPSQWIRKIDVVKRWDIISRNSVIKKDVSVNKDFKDNKVSFGKKNDFINKSNDKEESKRPKFWGFHKGKTRWRVNFIEDKEINFVRSNKINKKLKEEKNIEDIKQNLVDRKWETIIIPEFLSLKELSEKIWITLSLLMAEFMKNGVMVNINSKIDFETASIIAESFEIKLEKSDHDWANIEDILSWDLSKLLVEDDISKLKPRSPIVSIMWHVDHGKTSLLDYIRKSKVTTWEAWGITQSIWAYQVEMDKWKITFLDTPWHEAFTIMRARWAKLTDIAILVVAADEWVKPQTIESINHAKEAGIPIVVAINKMDKEWANPENIKNQLSEHWLIPEDWGGETPMIPVSALSGFWVDELLEIILLVAEMREFKANPDRNCVATVIESHLDNKFWPVATILINAWNLNLWDNIVCQDSYWKVKIMKNHISNNVKIAKIWEPVLLVWLDKVVKGWDILQVVSKQEIAKQKALEYKTILERSKSKNISGLDLLMSKIKAWNLKQLKVILKADTNWSLEAIKSSLTKLSTPETTVLIIHSWVWNITEGDILMWQWSEAILVWYNVWVLPNAKSLLIDSWVEYISSDIIYHITDRIEKIVTWMLDPKEIEIILSRAKVWGIFYTSEKFMVLWLIINDGENIANNTMARVIRNKNMIWSWKIISLKSWILEVKELEWPIECWVKFEWKIIIQMWDELEIYKTEIQK